MKYLISVLAFFVLSTPAVASNQSGDIPSETVAQIMEKLDGMKCQMVADDIELEDGVYELDDVICEGGNQYDIKLDTDLNEISRRAE